MDLVSQLGTKQHYMSASTQRLVPAPHRVSHVEGTW